MSENTVKTEESQALPWLGLLALAAAGFITILTEALPAGLLLQMSESLKVSESLVGQLVTIYAVGSLLAAIPLTTLTRSWPRRRLLLIAVSGFAVVNAVTAFSSSYALILVARFFAGVFAGLLWALLAGYAARMVPEHLKGRAIAMAMLGAPLALSLGIPAGTLLGGLLGWRYTFALMSVLTLFVIGWTLWKVPDFSGQEKGSQKSILSVLTMPGIRSVLFVTLSFVLAHNVLYTYIAPFLSVSGLADKIDLVLLVFGVCAIAGIWIIGVLIDKWLRLLTLASTALFILAALALSLWGDNAAVVYANIALWGLTFGGAATLFQTASAHAAGDDADIAQSMIVTVWNIAIAGGGIIGGIMLETTGAASLPWVLVILLMATLFVAWKARSHGFPRQNG